MPLAATKFHELSPELIDLLVSYLDNATLCALRLASKECYGRSLRRSIERVCRQRFLVAPHSLAALMSIAQDARVSPAFRILQLGSHYLEDNSTDSHSDEFFAEATTEAERQVLVGQQERY